MRISNFKKQIFSNLPSIYIGSYMTVYQHGKCFIFVKYNMKVSSPLIYGVDLKLCTKKCLCLCRHFLFFRHEAGIHIENQKVHAGSFVHAQCRLAVLAVTNLKKKLYRRNLSVNRTALQIDKIEICM